MKPATPIEFLELYKSHTEVLDAASVNTLVSDHMTLIWANGKPQTTFTKAEQLETLSKMYAAEKAAGTQIRAVDSSVTQLGADFATVKFTWATTKPGNEAVQYAHVSYVIRCESEGWRIVYVMELGSPM